MWRSDWWSQMGLISLELVVIHSIGRFWSDCSADLHCALNQHQQVWWLPQPGSPSESWRDTESDFLAVRCCLAVPRSYLTNGDIPHAQMRSRGRRLAFSIDIWSGAFYGLFEFCFFWVKYRSYQAINETSVYQLESTPCTPVISCCLWRTLRGYHYAKLRTSSFHPRVLYYGF